MSRNTNLENLSFDDYENLVLQMFDLQSGFVSCRRMAEELIKLHNRKMVKCPICGVVIDSITKSSDHFKCFEDSQ